MRRHIIALTIPACAVVLPVVVGSAAAQSMIQTMKPGAIAQHSDIVRTAGGVNVCGSTGCVRVQTHKIVRQKSGGAMANHI
jgi:hypothetical protein